MKKLLLGLALTVACAAQADSYLYWMLDTSSISGFTYDQVRVAAVNKYWTVMDLDLAVEGMDGYVSIGNYVTAKEADDMYDGGLGFYANLGAYASDAYTYYFELVTDGGKVVAHSTTGLTWEKAQTYIAKSAMSPVQGAWTATEFAAGVVPEPTSGMMLLLGVAALALRRRRA